MSTVLVTGGTGFVASHAILQLLAAGHDVRTTLRRRGREGDLRAMLAVGGADPGAPIAIHEADLERDEGWRAAVDGCEYVLHVASPFPPAMPKNEDELIVPARDGALRVLRAARESGVRRVVLTSSFAAIGYGHPRRTTPFDETTWTDLAGPGVTPYVKSKTIAERAAWDFVANGGPELAVVNPTGVLGPVLGRDYSTSIQMVARLLTGTPGCPRVAYGIVDVRDVADLHLRAMTHPAAKGERFLAASGGARWMIEIARILRERLGERAHRVTTRQLPDWLVRLAALTEPGLRSIAPSIGIFRDMTARKAETMLGWTPRSAEDAIAATGESLLRLHLVD